MLPIGPIVLLVRALSSASSGTSTSAGSKSFSGTSRAVFWIMGLVGWATMILLTMLIASDCIASRAWHDVAWLASFALLDVVGACGLFFAWPILRAIARRGRPTLVYRLAHLSLIFPWTGETYAGATLLAGIAFAHRGAVTKKEVAWLQSRLEKETRFLGTFGAAYALIEALKAKRARDKHRTRAAVEHAQRARTLFGTLTYMSPRAIPKGVLRFAYEYLALDDARLGHWGGVLLAPKSDATTVVRALGGWVRDREDEKPKPWEIRARKKLASPVVEGLFTRPKESTAPKDATEARAHLARDYHALLRGEPLGPRASLNLLALLDMFTHPEYPETLLPEEIRSDEALVDSIHDDLARSLQDAFLRIGVPIYALKNIGPISARVYQGLEAALLDELKTALDRCNEHKKLQHRRDAFAEWLEVSYVRAVYRRVEFTLGPEAAARVWRPFAYGYCNLGVLLSETWPRSRPLAFAIFRVLSLEAHRFKDEEQARQQLHNMTVTSGVH